jgi:hypothetical protein
MKHARMILAAAALLVINFVPVPAYALTAATISSNPADATITGRGIECAALDLTPVVSSIAFFQEFNPLLAAGVRNVTGHGAITATLENRDGVKKAFVNHPYDEEIPSLAIIELGVSGFNPKLEELYEERSNTDHSVLRYFVSPGSFSTGTFVFTIRGILHNADVLMFGTTPLHLPFRCSGAGMVEIRLPFSLVYE